MNGGGPLAAPLRALRHEPVLIDDLGAGERLAAVVGAVPAGALPLEPAEQIRWTRAWLVACQGMFHDLGVVGSDVPWTVQLPLAGLPSLKGDPENRRRASALDLLERASLAARSPDGGSLTLAERAFVPHRAGLEVAWGMVCRAVRWEPAPLLVARALAELIDPGGAPAPATLRELIDRTGYAAKQVRAALRRLADAQVLTMHESAGMPSQYCFGTVATARPPMQPPVSPVAAVPPSAGAPAAAVGRAAGRHVALRMTLNGVTVTLGAGLTPHVELGPDGVPHVTFDPPER